MGTEAEACFHRQDPFSPEDQIADNENPSNLLAELYGPGSDDPFGDQCKLEGGGADILIDIKGRVRDDHFSLYNLAWVGGDVNTFQSIPVTLPRNYGSRPDLSDEGTEPAAATDIQLGSLNLTAKYEVATGGEPIIECGYAIRLLGRDRSHLGVFSPPLNAFGHISGNTADYIQTFCLIP